MTNWHCVLSRTELLEHIAGFVFLFEVALYLREIHVVSMLFALLAVIYYL